VTISKAWLVLANSSLEAANVFVEGLGASRFDEETGDAIPLYNVRHKSAESITKRIPSLSPNQGVDVTTKGEKIKDMVILELGPGMSWDDI